MASYSTNPNEKLQQYTNIMLLRLGAFELIMDKETNQRANNSDFLVNATLTGYILNNI